MKIQILFQILRGALLLYVVYCCALFFMQGHIVFPRRQVRSSMGGTLAPPGVQRVWLDTSFGRVEAWYMPPGYGPADQAHPAVIFAHGNAEIIDSWPESLREFSRLGIGVLLVEYPGYGRSDGVPAQKTVTEAFVSAYDHLVARKDVDPSRILFFGRSLGGGAVCALAAERPPAALILLSTFTSMRSLAARFFIPGFLVRDPFDNLSAVRSYSGPVLVAHGTRDGLIPYEHGLALFRAAERGRMLTYECGHNTCPPDWGLFWPELTSFLRDAGIIKSVA